MSATTVWFSDVRRSRRGESKVVRSPRKHDVKLRSGLNLQATESPSGIPQPIQSVRRQAAGSHVANNLRARKRASPDPWPRLYAILTQRL